MRRFQLPPLTLLLLCYTKTLAFLVSTRALNTKFKSIDGVSLSDTKVTNKILRHTNVLSLLLVESKKDDEDSDCEDAQASYETWKSGKDSEEKPVFESLDSVLNKARKRPMMMFIPYKIQAALNKPILKLSLPTTSAPSIITLGDLGFILIALKLNSFGFAVGYILGKLSTQLLRESKVIPIALVELWTVLMAVGLDVVWNNTELNY